MEIDSGIQDDFTKDDVSEEDEHGVQQADAEFDLSQPLVAYGEGDDEVKLTGQEVIDRLTKMQELERQVADLTEKTKAAPVQVQPVQQQILQPQGQQVDPLTQIRGQAQDALERFANGDMEAIPALLDAIGQFAEIRAGATTSTTIQQQQAEQKFLSEHSDFTEAAQSGKVRDYLARHPEYGPIEGFLAMKLENQRSAYEQRIADLESKVAGATERGKKEGEQQTLKAAKAAGGLRILAGAGAGGGKASGKNGSMIKPGASLDEITEAMKQGLAKMRGGHLE